jgi:hypothetical protein
MRFGWDEGCGQGRGRRLQTTCDLRSQGRLGQLEGARLQLTIRYHKELDVFPEEKMQVLGVTFREI